MDFEIWFVGQEKNERLICNMQLQKHNNSTPWKTKQTT
jgi:hypothetical protein